MSEKVRFGLCNCYYALLTIGTDGTPSWAAPVAIPNAKDITYDRNVSETPVYADNKLIYVVKSETGASATLNVTLLTDEVKQALLGHKTDSKGHNIEVINGHTIYFALIYQIEGDTKARRSVILKCSAKLGSESSSTKSDNVTVNGDSLSISCYPMTDSIGNDIMRYEVDSDDTDYATVITAAPTMPTIV